MKPQISVIIINYNTRHFLTSCIKSVLSQTYPNIETIFIDNDSGDGSCEYIRKEHPQVTAVCNSENLGYTGAGNQGIKLAKGEYVMILNPDIIFEPDYIEKCITQLEKDKKIASIGGKILKYDFEKQQKTKIIDTVGISCFRNRRFIDEGQGVEDNGQFNEPKEVFGVSGACPIYRKEALEEIKYRDEYFDEDFFMYKEDIDLAWRLRLFGWSCFYLPSALAYHGRGTGVLKRFTHMEVYKNRSKLNKLQKYYSYKNQRLTQIKNEQFRGFLKDFFPILWKEILVTGYIIFREPFLIKSWLHMVRQLPSALKKRRHIMKNRKTGWKEMSKWLSRK